MIESVGYNSVKRIQEKEAVCRFSLKSKLFRE